MLDPNKDIKPGVVLSRKLTTGQEVYFLITGVVDSKAFKYNVLVDGRVIERTTSIDELTRVDLGQMRVLTGTELKQVKEIFGQSAIALP
jgi:hypothetical protein